MSETEGILYPEVQEDGAMVTAPSGREGTEIITCSHNFCDTTTWYSTSTRVTEETLVDSGDGLTFELPAGSSSNVPWIDLTHGKVLWEEIPFPEHGLIVTVDAVEVIEDPMYGSLADYSTDFVAGTVTFHVSQAGKTVKATYSYPVTSEWILKPEASRIAVIEDAEIQFSSDLSYNDCMRVAPWGYCIVFAPELAESNGGPIPDYQLIELEPRVRRYKRHDQILDEARGAYPVIGTVAGIGGSSFERYGYPLIYKTITELHSAYGMELRVSLENNIPLGGERSTVTFYGVCKPEAS